MLSRACPADHKVVLVNGASQCRCNEMSVADPTGSSAPCIPCAQGLRASTDRTVVCMQAVVFLPQWEHARLPGGRATPVPRTLTTACRTLSMHSALRCADDQCHGSTAARHMEQFRPDLLD